MYIVKADIHMPLKNHRLCSGHKKGGDPCTNIAMANGVCRFHNGGAARGVASPTFKHGRYSKYLPTRLQSRFEDAQRDPDLLSMRSDIALISTRLSEVLGKLETGESREAWGLLASEWGDLREVLSKANPRDTEKALDRVTKLIADGLAETYIWSEVRKLLQERASLVEGERRRLAEMQQFMTKEQAFVMISAVLDIIRRHERDPHVLNKIAIDVGAITAPGAVE